MMADQFAMLATSIVTLLVVFLGTLVWRFLSPSQPGRKIPGPKASFLGGNLRDLHVAGGPAGFCEYLERLHRKYGPVTRLWLGFRHLMVSIRDPDLAKMVLINARDRSPDKSTQPLLDSMVFSSDQQARLLRPFLDYHCHTTLMFKVHSLSTTVAEETITRWSMQAADNKEVNVKLESRRMVTGVLGASIFGDKFLSSPVREELGELVTRVAGNQQKLWSSIFLRFSSSRRKLKEDMGRLKEVVEELVDMACESSQAGTQDQAAMDFTRRATLKDTTEDFIKAMLAEETVLGEKLYSEDKAKMGALTLMFHGCLTVATVLADTLTCVAQNPHAQKQLHRELDIICRAGPPQYEEQLDLMHYLLACIYESARLGPIQAVLKRCSIDSDLKVGDFVVPAGAMVAIPTQALQSDPAAWGEDAASFNPERFLKRQVLKPDGRREVKLAQSFTAARANAGGWRGAALSQNNPGPTVGPTLVSMSAGRRGYDPRMGIEGSGLVNQRADCYAFVDPGAGPYYLLFGAGPRACVGRRFALHLLRALLANLFHHFEIQLAPGSGAPHRLVVENLMLSYAPDASIILTPRKHAG